MPTLRFTILGLLAATTFVAVGSLALVYATAWWAAAALSAALGVLVWGVLRATYRQGGTRAFWIGYCLVGWIYLAMAFWPGTDSVVTELRSHLLTTQLLEVGASALGELRPEEVLRPEFFVVGHALWSVVLGCLGGWTGCWLQATRPAVPTASG
jgi:hypothetical protein